MNSNFSRLFSSMTIIYNLVINGSNVMNACLLVESTDVYVQQTLVLLGG